MTANSNNTNFSLFATLILGLLIVATCLPSPDIENETSVSQSNRIESNRISDDCADIPLSQLCLHRIINLVGHSVLVESSSSILKEEEEERHEEERSRNL